MRHTVVKIDPAAAEKLLATMKHNRKLSTRNVERLAQQMKDGLWIYDGSPIRFNTKGELVDGQHRLWALIEADYTAEFLVVYDIDQLAMATMDTGKSRSFSDILSLEDGEIPQITAVAAATQALYRWEDGRRGSALVAGGGQISQLIPNAILLEFFRENRDRIVEVARAGATAAARIRGLSGTTFAIGYWVFDGIDAADAKFFFEHLFDGAGLEEGSPILAFRNYLIRATQGSDVRSRLPIDLGTALMIKAWNFYREGTSVKAITYRRGGSNPEQFPTPK